MPKTNHSIQTQTRMSASNPPRAGRPPGETPDEQQRRVLVNVNDEVTGTVTHITNYGAFVDLGNGQSGLVHISEITDTFVKSVQEFLSVGDTVNVRILKIDDDLKKISLSIRQSITARSHGYDRVVELGGDWGHPWNDDGEAKYIDLGPQEPRRPHHWEPDLSLFEPFNENEDSGKEDGDTDADTDTGIDTGHKKS